MRRREFLSVVAGTAAASSVLWPRSARAQRTDRLRRVAVLSSIADDNEGRFRVESFQKGLREHGWTEGRNIRTEIRWGAGDVGRIRAYASELVAMTPDAVLAIATPALQALRQATTSLPIVFTNVGDLAESGIIESLARPGGHITGITTFVQTMGGKWLELLKEVAPSTASVLVILNPDNPTSRGVLRTIEAVAPSFGVTVAQAGVHGAEEIEQAINAFAREPGAGLIVVPDPATVNNRERLIALAARHRIPAVYPFRFFVASGGLLSYGTVSTEQYRQAASYVDRILKGANPGDLPVHQPTKFELIVNLKAAKAMGLTIPETFLLRANEVIE